MARVVKQVVVVLDPKTIEENICGSWDYHLSEFSVSLQMGGIAVVYIFQASYVILCILLTVAKL